MQLIIPILALGITASLIFALMPLAIRFGLVDQPNHRKQHLAPTPLIGGLAIYISLMLVLGAVQFNFFQQYPFMLASTILVGVGLWDDYKGLSVKFRLAAQVCAAFIMIEGADLKITELGSLFWLGKVSLDFFSTPLTVIAIVGGINAFNMIDGIDGLAGSLSLVSLASFALIAWLLQDLPLLYFCSILMAVLTGFLAFNLRIFGRKRAKIFLGDCGSTLLGFTICCLAIYSAEGEHALVSPGLVLWLIALPLVDSICIICRRLQKGRSPFAADREHLHHILSLLGFSVNGVVAILVVSASSLALLGIALEFEAMRANDLLVTLFVLMTIVFFWCTNHAWTVMKILRFVHSDKNVDRRLQGDRRSSAASVNLLAIERRLSTDRRELNERRYRPNEMQLNNFSVSPQKSSSLGLLSVAKSQFKVLLINKLFYRLS